MEKGNGIYNIKYNKKEDMTKIVVPSYVNTLETIDLKSKEVIQELELPIKLKTIGLKALVGLRNLKKIIFNIDTLNETVIMGLEKLEEVEIRALHSTVCRIKFSNLPNLRKVTIGGNPYKYITNSFSNCPKLDISNLINDSIIEIEELAFNKVKISNVSLPESVRIINTNSFVRYDGESVNIQSRNRNLFIKNKTYIQYNKDNTFNLAEGTAISHLKIPPNNIIIVEGNLSPEIRAKIKKMKILGINTSQYSIANSSKDMLDTLLLINDKYLKNEINKMIKISERVGVIRSYLVSNGYSAIQFNFHEYNRSLSTLHKKDFIGIMKLSRSTIILYKSTVYVFLTDKELIRKIIEDNNYSDSSKLECVSRYTIKCTEIAKIAEEKDRINIYFKDGSGTFIRY